MGFSKFEISVAAQVVLIGLVALVLGWTILNPHMQFSVVYFAVIFVLQLVLLIFTIRRNNRKIHEFLVSLTYDDTPAIPAKTDRSLRDLYEVLMEISKKYSDARSAREAGHQLFLHSVKHVNVGLLICDENGKVELANEALNRLLQVENLRTLEALYRKYPSLEGLFTELKPSRPVLIRLVVDDRLVRLSVQLSLFNMQQKRLRLILFQDINSELQQEEIETWQKLISILRHEIMNSMGPITSLSKTLKENFAEFAAANPGTGTEFVENTRVGLAAIEKRSAGLMRFVETYRKLSKIPKPEFETLQVCDLLFMVKSLLADELEKSGVEFRIHCTDRDISISADEKLISQVLINLVRNAMQASADAEIRLIETEILHPDGRVIIRVRDHGEGIAPDQLDKVFIPFFTTRSGGSGIGLSLSRQIMQLHGGSIGIQSAQGEGTVVEVRF